MLNVMLYKALEAEKCFRYGHKIGKLTKRQHSMLKYSNTAYVRTIFNRSKWTKKTWNICRIKVTTDEQPRYYLDGVDPIITKVSEKGKMKFYVKQNTLNV